MSQGKPCVQHFAHDLRFSWRGAPSRGGRHCAAAHGDDFDPETEALPWKMLDRAAAVEPGDTVVKDTFSIYLSKKGSNREEVCARFPSGRRFCGLGG
jgi:hypothetical protein